MSQHQQDHLLFLRLRKPESMLDGIYSENSLCRGGSRTAPTKAIFGVDTEDMLVGSSSKG